MLEGKISEVRKKRKKAVKRKSENKMEEGAGKTKRYLKRKGERRLLGVELPRAIKRSKSFTANLRRDKALRSPPA